MKYITEFNNTDLKATAISQERKKLQLTLTIFRQISQCRWSDDAAWWSVAARMRSLRRGSTIRLAAASGDAQSADQHCRRASTYSRPQIQQAWTM